MILKWTSYNEQACDSSAPVWHVLSGIYEIEYGYVNKYAESEAESHPIDTMTIGRYVAYFKSPKNEGAPANVICLEGGCEAYLMSDDGKTIERIR